MVELQISLSDSELISEVRTTLAGLDATKIPDDTIVQTAEDVIVPLLNDVTGDLSSDDQEGFDNAAVAWTAEMSFNAWLAFTRLRDREVETYIDPKQYINQLEKRTNLALRQVNATRPPEIPNYHVTVNKGEVEHTFNLQEVTFRV